MIEFIKDETLKERKIPFGYVEARYPEKLNAEAFYETAERVIAHLREEFAQYDRKAVFGEQAYSRFFKKFKKTYPVLLQFESCLFGERPFPRVNAVAEVPFLAELDTRVLMGAHDAECVRGRIVLTSGTEKEPFEGMRGEAHTYPNDVVGRDDGGVIISMIAGADARTCAHEGSRHVFYPVFGVPEQNPEELKR
ncbi:MAG: hypothetical protein IKN53_00985, partial [Oscillibacter sp.]|nr:hypothetical protein [Oscillibacter sp.]